MMTTILVSLSIGLATILIIWNTIQEIRMSRFMRGNNGKSLEKTIGMVLQKIKDIETENQILKEKNRELDLRLRKSIRTIETVRFNPFADQGSNQSFATALVNDEKDGVIISTLFARDRTAIFAKPIKNGQSDYELTAEEKLVLDRSTQ